MTTAKELLDAATPLPWSVGKSVFHDGHNLWQTETQGDITSPDAHLAQADADLIVFAVNRLPDYDDLREAVEYYFDPVRFLPGVESAAEKRMLAALARLREQVPA
jgi:hypothetical protein